MQISIVIPCFNAVAYLGGALESVALAMGNAQVEALVVDDGSTDESLALLASLNGLYPWLNVISQDNAGPAAARNAGAEAAQGDFLLFLDADDELQPDVLEDVVDFLKASPEKDFWIGRYAIRDAEGNAFTMPCRIKDPAIGPQLRDYLDQDLAIGQGSYLIRRSKFLDLGFPEGLSTQEDVPFFMACLARLSCQMLDLDLALYHRYRGSVSQARAEALAGGFPIWICFFPLLMFVLSSNDQRK